MENGAIVGISSKEHPVGNTYIVYRGFEAKDFDLKLEIKVENGGGSGIQYRSRTGIPWRRPAPNVATNLDWLLTGPQADIWYPVGVLGSMFTGQFYSDKHGRVHAAPSLPDADGDESASVSKTTPAPVSA